MNRGERFESNSKVVVYSLEEQERHKNAKQKRARPRTRALREENLFPEGLPEDNCEFYRTQLLWHIESRKPCWSVTACTVDRLAKRPLLMGQSNSLETLQFAIFVGPVISSLN